MNFLVVLCLWPTLVASLENGAARTPPMGWSSWNKVRCHFDDQLLLQMADAMESSGMVAAGYSTLNIDDCWPKRKREADGRLLEDPSKFPTGMRNFSSELRMRGLGLGIYTSHGNFTCQKYPGSYGFEAIDAKAYADWGVDYVKNDWCSNRRGFPAVPDLDAFQKMRDALNQTGRRMVYSVHWNYGSTKGPTCDKGVSCPLPAVANMWRIGGDISPSWGKVLRLIDIDAPLAANAGPGHWNDADMLEVGNGMSADQDRAHFTMWCMLASPLIAGNDVRNMSEITRSILTNKHAIAVNQDSLGQQARLIDELSDAQIWARQLTEPDGSWAVALLNRGNEAQNITANFASLPFVSPDDRMYHNPSLKPPIAIEKSVKYVKFSVLAKNDAHIKLFSGNSYYSFIFGGSANTQSWIRRNTDSKKVPGTRVETAPLDADSYTDLWVSVDVASGNVSMGRGKTVGQDVITEFVDDAVIDPADYAVRTGWGSTGVWRFPEASASFEVLDLWEDAASLGVHVNSITASVPPTAATMYKLVPATAVVI